MKSFWGLVVLCCWVGAGWAANEKAPDTTQETVLRWVETFRSATPEFQPGETLKLDDLEKVQPFLPPGYFEEYDFPDVEFVITQTGDYPPHPAYREATEKFAGQTRLAADGALENYTAGQPFPNASLDTQDPESGIKAAWNFNFRWQHYGQRVNRYAYLLVRGSGTHGPIVDLPEGIIRGRGGQIERVLWQRYQRVYFTHLAILPTNNYTFPAPEAEQFEFKDYSEFLAPYEQRGQRTVIQRPADPRLADQAWSYSPSLRRVRRFSAEERADSFAGTDATLDDFYGFSGHPLDYNWTFHGWKEVLHVMNSRYQYPHYYGPNGWLPYDRRELRRCAVVEMVPKDPRHPYSSKLLFWDAQTYRTAIALAFDRDGKLWKIWQPQNSWSEDTVEKPNPDQGLFVARYEGVTTIDVQNRRATLYITFEMDYPAVTPVDIEGLFDLNKLTEGRR